MNGQANIFVSLIPLLYVVLWVFMLRDWYLHAVYRRQFWLVLIIFAGVIGYAFFINSPDRQ